MARCFGFDTSTKSAMLMRYLFPNCKSIQECVLFPFYLFDSCWFGFFLVTACYIFETKSPGEAGVAVCVGGHGNQSLSVGLAGVTRT